MIMEMLKRRIRFVPRGTNVISQPQDTAQGAGGFDSTPAAPATPASPASPAVSAVPAAPTASAEGSAPDASEGDSWEIHPETVLPEDDAAVDAAEAF